MTYGRRLLLTLRWTQVPLVVGVALPFIAVLVLADVLGRDLNRRFFISSAFLSAKLYTYALIVVLLYGAPVYAWLAHIGRANWLTATLLGVAPGLGALLIGIYPSGRLADANATIGPLVTVCGVFVALMTHALVRAVPVSAPPSQPVASVVRGSARVLARIFVLGAFFGWVVTVILARNAVERGGLVLVYGAASFVVPFLLAALASAVYASFTTSKPRRAGPVFEMLGILLVGGLLLMPAAYVVVSLMKR